MSSKRADCDDRSTTIFVSRSVFAGHRAAVAKKKKNDRLPKKRVNSHSTKPSSSATRNTSKKRKVLLPRPFDRSDLSGSSIVPRETREAMTHNHNGKRFCFCSWRRLQYAQGNRLPALERTLDSDRANRSRPSAAVFVQNPPFQHPQHDL